FVAKTHDYLLFFTDRGKVYKLKVYEVPEAGRHARGTAVVNLIMVTGNEKITAVIPVTDFTENSYLFMATRRGVVKKTRLEEFDTVRRDGLIALSLDDGDELVDVEITDGAQDVMITTQKGMAIRFNETDVRPMGRTARGMRGIMLGKKDQVLGMHKVLEGAWLMVITARGHGKLTALDEFRPQARGGKGLIATKISGVSGDVVATQVVKREKGEEIMLVSKVGVLIRLRTKDVLPFGRPARGVLLMRLGEGDRVVGVTQVTPDD
ncbi:MAG: DNA gyrase C-terminal beta-propeller domain-containing protein, partial [Candidatus Desulforudaceae bacterium]